MVTKVPKRGFNNRWAIRIAAVNVAALEKHFAAGDEVTPDALVAKNLTKGRFDQLKLLGDGELTKKLRSRRIASASRPRKRSKRPAAKQLFSPARRRS